MNLLDALNAWQLVSEIKQIQRLPAAASFKHVSPAGAAVAVPLPPDLARAYELAERELSPLALAYARARGADPMSSFGDFIALSDPVDRPTAEFIKTMISDGIVAPGYEPGVLEVLSAKKKGTFVVFETDPNFQPPATESREVFGMRLTQVRNTHVFGVDDLSDVVCVHSTIRLTEICCCVARR